MTEIQSPRQCSSYSVAVDAYGGSLIFTRHDWTQIRQKTTYEDTGRTVSRYTSMPCSNFWMRYSLWNGEKRKNLMIIAIPPLTVYPIVDSVVLLGCFIGDCCIFPVVWCHEQVGSEIVIPAGKSESGELISEFRVGNVVFYDIARNRSNGRIVNSPVIIRDGNDLRHYTTDSIGTLRVSQAVPFLFPIRNIQLVPEGPEFEGKRQSQLSTGLMLDAEQKLLWQTVNDFAVPLDQRISAWEKLEPVCEPRYYKKFRSRLIFGSDL